MDEWAKCKFGRRVLPPVFERRGVIPVMFTGDKQKRREIFDAWCHASDMELLTCCLTCGLSSLWICLTGCWGGGAETRYRKQLDDLIDEMNVHYHPYGIVWV
jgi:hypothetical protein